MISVRQPRHGVPTWVLLFPALAYLLVVFIVPLLTTLWTSMSDPEFGLQNYRQIIADPLYRKVYLRTLLVALSVSVCCLVLGFPLAHYMARKGGMVATAMLGATGLCFWISFLVRTYAWTVILGNKGPLTVMTHALGIEHPPVLLFTTAASLIAMTHILLPYMVLTLYIALSRIDPNLFRAAHGLGANRRQTFRWITVPQALPAVISGSLLVFIFCIGFYVTPTLLGSPRDMMISSLIANEIESLIDFGSASAISMVLLACILCLLMVYDRVVGLDRIVR